MNRRLSRAAAVLVFLAWPFAVTAGLELANPRRTALVLLALGIVVLLGRLRGRREGLAGVASVPLLALSAPLLSALFNERIFLLLLPVLVNVALLAVFARSLREPPPMIERFARLVHDDLTEAERAHCLTFTKVWCAFFAGNAAVALALAVFAPLRAWTVYTGLVSYLLLGLLFAVEYLVRKAKFRRFGTGLHDRILLRLLPGGGP